MAKRTTRKRRPPRIRLKNIQYAFKEDHILIRTYIPKSRSPSEYLCVIGSRIPEWSDDLFVEDIYPEKYMVFGKEENVIVVSTVLD